MQFGRLTVVEHLGRRERGHYWRCACVCGNTKDVLHGSLTFSQTRSCGCLAEEARIAKRTPDLTGQQFGELTVLQMLPERKRKRTMWLCACSCGKQTAAFVTSLLRGDKKSCGCWTKRFSARRTHGRTHTAEYSSWLGAKRRCTDENDEAYKDYGQRGIFMCDAWLGSFEAFFRDMGEKPGAGYSIDRLDNDGPYNPENCRWATQTEQVRNRRNTKRLTYMGVTKLLVDWSQELGINEGTLRSRLRRGLTVEEALQPGDRRLKHTRAG